MKTSKIVFLVFMIFLAVSTYADPDKVYIEYEHTGKNSANKMIFKLYKDGDKYKLVRNLSDSPGETGVVTTYIDVTAGSVVSVTEKNGLKKGLNTVWSDDYTLLNIQFPVFFRGIPPGKAYMSYKKTEVTEIVNGKECDIYQGPIDILQQSSKYYLWDRIMLKSTAPGYETIATTINEDPAFTADEFTVPADVQF